MGTVDGGKFSGIPAVLKHKVSEFSTREDPLMDPNFHDWEFSLLLRVSVDEAGVMRLVLTHGVSFGVASVDTNVGDG